MHSSKIALTTISIFLIALMGLTSSSYAQNYALMQDDHNQISRNVANVQKNATSIQLIEEANSLMNSSTQSMINEKLSGMVEAIANGTEKTFTVNMTSAQHTSSLEGHAVKVNVSYDQRPIGGILNVKVEVLPKFVGIGVVPRAIAKKVLATAVDNLDDAQVAEIIAQMTKEIAQEMASLD